MWVRAPPRLQGTGNYRQTASVRAVASDGAHQMLSGKPCAQVWRGKSIGDENCLENSRAKALGVRLPLSPPHASVADWEAGASKALTCRFESYRACKCQNLIGI